MPALNLRAENTLRDEVSPSDRLLSANLSDLGFSNNTKYGFSATGLQGDNRSRCSHSSGTRMSDTSSHVRKSKMFHYARTRTPDDFRLGSV